MRMRRPARVPARARVCACVSLHPLAGLSRVEKVSDKGSPVSCVCAVIFAAILGYVAWASRDDSDGGGSAVAVLGGIIGVWVLCCTACSCVVYKSATLRAIAKEKEEEEEEAERAYRDADDA